MDTLVLDFSCTPVGRMSWQRAITQWMKGKVEIINSYEDRLINSPSRSLAMPAVVRELTYYKKRNAVKFSRDNVYARDRGRCQYCDMKVDKLKATYDHVIPRDRGGKTKWDNIVIACFMCNQKKRNRTPEEANMRLRIAPTKPKSLPAAMKTMLHWRNDMPNVWRDWLALIENDEPSQE